MNKKKRHYSFLILSGLLISLSVAQGQATYRHKIDSLRKVIATETGNDKISARLELALLILNKDKDEALSLTQAALNEARSVGNKTLEMRAIYGLGRINIEIRNNEESLDYLNTALSMAETLKDNWYKGEIMYWKGVDEYRLGEYVQALETFNNGAQALLKSDNFKHLGSTYSMIASIFRMNGLYDRAIEYTVRAKLNYDKADFTEGSAWTAYLLGRIYADLKLPEKAHENFLEALEKYSKQASADGNNNGKAICYEQLAILNIESEDFEKARENINKAMEIYTTDNSKFGLANVYKHLGVIEYSTGNYALAEKHLTQSLQIKKEVNDNLSMPGIYEYMGLSLIEQGNTKEGFKTMRQGLQMAIKNNQKKTQLDIYSKLTHAYLSINDFESAFASQNKEIEIQNLILSGAANIKTEQLQAIYEMDEKNSQIAELEKQNEINELNIRQQQLTRNIMIIGIILVLFISLSIIWFNRKLRQNNRKLNETNAAKDRFFAIIAHDLRGPTSALASLLEHLNSSFDEFSADELKDILSTLYKSAENVSQLLENLLVWVQSQVDKIEYRPKDLKLTNILQNALKGLSQSAENKQIDISIEKDDSTMVFADNDMVQTILRNILSNAIKFTPRGGSVKVWSAVTDKKMVEISIADNGVGIEKSKLANIFDLANLYHTKGTENEMSTGLGLILVKDFVDKNKGTLSIKSEQGKGTTVSFTLPGYPASA